MTALPAFPSRFAFFLAALAALLCACVDPLGDTKGIESDGDPPDSLDGDTETDGEDEAVKPWAIAVLGTDYVSSGLSILGRETQDLFRDGVLHSGSASAGLSVALSGDVVLPRSPNPRNWIVLIDRYPNSVLTFVDPENFAVIGQLGVSTGFASNPRDFLWISDNKAYVSRYERNTLPGRERLDEGDDILIVDPQARSLTGRIPLSACADTAENPRLQARPSQMTRAEGNIWVVLEHLSDHFDAFGEGKLAALDPETDEVLTCLTLPGLSNCTALVYSPVRKSLFVACSGPLRDKEDDASQGLGIAQVDLSGDAPAVSILSLKTDSSDQPFGFELELAGDAWLLAVRFGDLARDIPDRLVAIDLATLDEQVLHEAGTAFGLGGILADDSARTLYVGEADPTNPGIYRYQFDAEGFTPRGVIDPSPVTGLPPRHIRFY